MVQKLEVEATGLRHALEAKEKENKELSRICDELLKGFEQTA